MSLVLALNNFEQSIRSNWRLGGGEEEEKGAEKFDKITTFSLFFFNVWWTW